MTLSITDLFTPAPSGVGPNPPPSGSWLSMLLQFGTVLQLKTTAWQPGGITRTILAIMATALNQGDNIVSIMNQGGFLDSAASVTDDPSVDPLSEPGWLDYLAQSNFGTQRTPATFATGPMNITNATANTYGPFAPGTYHVDNPSTGQGYHNLNQLTIGPSGVTSGSFTADVAGQAGTAAAGAINHSSNSLQGVTVSNPSNIVGSNAQSNASLVAACRAKFASRSPNGPGGAYVFFALQSALLLVALNPTLPTLSGTPVTIATITQAIRTRNPATGVVTTTVANANGVVPGATNLPVTAASNATPIQITSANHGLSTGMWATVSGVLGNSAANVTTTLTKVDNNNFTLDGTTGSGAYTSGGVVEGGDLGQVDRIIQANCVPDGVTAITQSAALNPLAVVVDVWVPASYAATIQAAVQTRIALYFSNAPIGGYTDPGGAYTNVIPYDRVLAEVFASAVTGNTTVVQQATATLGGFAVNFPVSPTGVAVPTSITVNVHIVGGN